MIQIYLSPQYQNNRFPTPLPQFFSDRLTSMLAKCDGAEENMSVKAHEWRASLVIGPVLSAIVLLFWLEIILITILI